MKYLTRTLLLLMAILVSLGTFLTNFIQVRYSVKSNDT